MTVFNAERFLSESINSLLAQDFENWELNVVENGSTDRSAEILSAVKLVPLDLRTIVGAGSLA